MNKRILKIISISMIFSVMFSIMAFAAPRKNWHIPPTDTQLLPSNRTYSEDTYLVLERGAVLSSSVIRISNLRNGNIGILALTATHQPADWGYITIYLDRWSEEKQIWENCEVYEFEFLPEDFPNGEMSIMAVDFDEKGQEPEHYYRLWSYHEVEKDGRWETKRVSTDGVLITGY